VGGGNQLFRQKYNGADVGDEISVPLQIALINDIVVFVNGIPVNNYTYSAASQYSTVIEFDTEYTDQDYILVTVLGQPLISDHSWSSPVTEYFVSDGSTLQFNLNNSLQGTNPANIIVEVMGRRARPAAGQEYTGDGSTVTFALPLRGGYDPNTIANNEVTVYVNNQPLIQSINYVVDPADSSSDRTVTLFAAPPVGADILISVDTNADYFFSGSSVIWRSTSGLLPLAGDVVSFTTWNDTAEQNIVTKVFVGPTSQGAQISQPYDSTDYDLGDVSGDPGSYDYAEGTIIQTNRFDIGRTIASTDRVIVSVNGIYKFSGLDFIEEQNFLVEGSEIVFPGAPINAAAVVAVTVFTNSVVPGSIGFRIFQDMRGTQLSYRILESTSTTLVEDLLASDDEIVVQDAARLPTPNMPLGIFGQITINGERITYRAKDNATNTLSGLRRGTAGTAAADHLAGAAVYSIAAGNLLPADYQNRTLESDVLGNGSTTVFVAEDISVTGLSSTDLDQAVQVYVGGILQQGNYTITASDPVTVEFDQAPRVGYQVSIRVRRGEWWYGVDTLAEQQTSLQENPSLAARFIRGE
jgi:hypothetical protein